MKLFPRAATALALLAVVFLAPAGLAQGAKSALTLESVKVEPASPGPDTLCALSVTVRNAGSRRASALEFSVKVNGQELPAYKDRLYLNAVEPGATREIRLLKLWSTEAGRPAPADGRLKVEVTLARALWMDREIKDGAEVWTPAGSAEGLPVTKSITLPMGKK
ncbi:MAG TPA: CARDB domain-containing protein [Thermoanaerobaculia bacterium]|nr:CARDB domain-containing protein [Thermoanaerobaculia bacterium]